MTLMDPLLQKENTALARCWDGLSAEHLRAYLVSDVEDPRINAQSILSRALIADTLWPGELGVLIDEELRFGAVLTWVLLQLKDGAPRDRLLSVIEEGAAFVPAAVVETSRWLRQDTCPLHDYLTEAVLSYNPDTPSELLAPAALDTFRGLWRGELAERTSPGFTLLEPACGSANDYRFIAGCGFSKFVQYTGFDITTKNIRNARRDYPGVRFFVGSVFDIAAQDGAFDYVMVHDLFEHLSPAGLEAALAEVMRVTGREAWLHFFNLGEEGEHVIHAVEGYHWNLLSEARVVESLGHHAASIDVVRIPDLLKEKFGIERHYNRESATLIVTKQA